MLRNITGFDRAKLRELSLENYPINQKKVINYLFDNNYEDYTGIINENYDNIAAFALERKGNFKYRNKVINCGIISFVGTHKDYHNEILLEDVIEKILFRHDKKYLLTLINTYQPSLLEKYGFKTVGYYKTLKIMREDLQLDDINGVSNKYQINELKKCYEKFSKAFQGSYVRSDLYYDNLMRLISDQHDHIITYYENGEIKGYAIYHINGNYAQIKEIIYLDSLSLCKMICYCLRNFDYVEVKVSGYEKIERIFKDVQVTKQSYLMVRINDESLFKNYFELSDETLINKGFVFNYKEQF